MFCHPFVLMLYLLLLIIVVNLILGPIVYSIVLNRSVYKSKEKEK
jgi:hypothetical protein